MNRTLPRPFLPRALLCAGVLVSLIGCDMLGVESASSMSARREAEGKAIGGACRHAGRALEDCYSMNRKADKAAVFAGWREMNDYMRENKVETVSPQVVPSSGLAKSGEDAKPVKP
ncbi:MAG: hypothetical protein WCT47_14145 [Betaproteobacteria bacterium]|jgi:hypothetical protein